MRQKNQRIDHMSLILEDESLNLNIISLELVNLGNGCIKTWSNQIEHDQ
jgi:hypothetical protein